MAFAGVVCAGHAVRHIQPYRTTHVRCARQRQRRQTAIKQIRGIYGGVPREVVDRGQSLADLGVNAIFVGANGVDASAIEFAADQGVKLFAEFNTLHIRDFLTGHPDAAPVGPDGQVSPPPHDWQGICPTHQAYREWRMHEFRRVLAEYPVSGMWLDYLHSHSSWERADPVLPDTCFCDRCLSLFQSQTGVAPAGTTTPEKSAWLLRGGNPSWVRWRCDVLTDWAREFRAIIDATRPGALLGTFHCPWADEDFDGARIKKLHIDLQSHAKYIDVFSPMPYHARFGHAADPEWIRRQTRWLGEHLAIRGESGERHKIWPIVQVTEWGEEVPVAQVHEVIEHGLAAPSTGVMVFAWSKLKSEPGKISEMADVYRRVAAQAT